MYYDRSVSPDLLSALQPGKPFARLVHFARTNHLADLQLRGYPHEKRCWATLYLGLTKVLDVIETNGRFSLRGNTKLPAWDDDWKRGRGLEDWKVAEADVNAYLDRAIREVHERYTVEGAVQAALCTRASDLFSVIDREAVIGFASNKERETTYERLQGPLRKACAPDPALPWFIPKRFGGELDLLAVDDRGRLLAIEVKPASATAGIAWAPFQATFYAELLKAWSEEQGEDSRRSLQSMLQQRIDHGLTRDPNRALKFPLEIIPVVAIGGDPKSPEALRRLRHVQETLLSEKVGWPSLEVWIVEDAVKRQEVSPLSSIGK
jgi:hypothetical protein